jgi:hypothetical protein
MSNFGDAEGRLSLTSTGRMIASDILAFHPEIQAKLDEIEKKGWKYLYIETIGTSKSEITLAKSTYKIMPSPYHPEGRGLPDNIVEITIGHEVPKVKAVPEVPLFKVNVCSASFPRAATVDLSKDEVTYLHEPFWKWEVGSEVDEKKLSDAKEVYEIAAWLIDEKKFKLGGEVTEQRYSELSYRFKKILGSHK